MIYLNGNGLTLEEMRRVVYEGERIAIEAAAMDRVRTSRAWVEQAVAKGEVIYGVTTGFGKFSDVVIEHDDVQALQENLLRSHACGVGEPLAVPIVRAMMLMRLNALVKGFSGVRQILIETLAACLNEQVHPVIPSQGSLGASGDLAPLSHLALVLIGEGEAWRNGERVSAIEVLQEKAIEPLQLAAKEGLALINGTQAMAAIGGITLLQARRLADLADAVGSMTVEALQGVIDAYSPYVQHARGFKEQEQVAERLLGYLEGSQLTTRQSELRVQDAYALRCIPQVHGATRQVLAYAEDKVVTDMNAATDNPLIFAEEGMAISGGNFHGQPVAFAMDFLKIGMAELANISERRIERLVNPQLSSGLRPFLSPKPGLMSGMMIPQYVAASLVSENKVLCHPSSVDSIPSSGNQEDHVSMGTTAARHALKVVENVGKVLAIEAICAAAALDERGIDKMAPPTRKLYEAVRQISPRLTKDRSLTKDFEELAELILSGRLESVIAQG